MKWIFDYLRRLAEKPKPDWTHAGLTFLLTILAAGILLPLVRVQPESVHKYFNGLSDWLRVSFAFFLCVVFTATMFRLLSPRIGHLAHWKSYPPAWLAALLAWFVVAIVDLVRGFGASGYRASPCEWLGYGGGSLLIVGWYSGLWSEILQRVVTSKTQHAGIATTVTLQDIENATWEEIEEWLRSDAPARYDFLDNQVVADRVTRVISSGARSVGIVGPFGAGKTSLIKWVTDRLTTGTNGGRRYFVCHHSCWGFETSASAIHDILASAISKLGSEIDTFQVDSLPESYRQTFSAGGDWVETISKLVLRNPDPMEQFERLSELLDDVGGIMVLIVEDLDRNETRNFEIQEVLAFLERLKPFPNLKFVLTGGLSSSLRIDYAKLCDHIEYLRTIQPHHSSGLIERISERCLDPSVFPHVRLEDTSRNYAWNPLTGMLMTDYEELSLPQAVATLLNTPRSLRHALGRTFNAWQTLHGEIDFNHLLAVNILRFGAPECFQFLIRRWDRLNSPPSSSPSFGQERIAGIRQAIVDDWNRSIQNVEWNPTAALQVMEFILPATEYWLVDSSRHGTVGNAQQGVHKERYWRRAVNESIDANDVRDQQVIEDIQDWIRDPRMDSPLVNRLCSKAAYSDLWEDFAYRFFANDRDRILSLCDQVLERIRQDHGAAASSDSQGFIAIWRYANRHVQRVEANSEWLRAEIAEAATVSLELVNSLWHYWGAGNHSILRTEDRASVRRHIIDVLQRQLITAESLEQITHPTFRYVFYQLVFDPGDNTPVLAGPEFWGWIGSVLLAGLKARQVTTAIGVCSLIAARDGSSRREPSSANPALLRAFFRDDAEIAIDAIERLIPQIDENDRAFVTDIVASARSGLAGDDISVESE